MPKMKTKKSAAKRFKVTGSGKVTYNKSGTYKFLVPLFPIITNYHQIDY